MLCGRRDSSHVQLLLLIESKAVPEELGRGEGGEGEGERRGREGVSGCSVSYWDMRGEG